MAESGHKLGSMRLSKAVFEELLVDGLQNINVLMKLSSEKTLTLSQDDWQSFTSAIYALDFLQRQMSK